MRGQNPPKRCCGGRRAASVAERSGAVTTADAVNPSLVLSLVTKAATKRDCSSPISLLIELRDNNFG
jgi:hypothetical protein